MNNTDSQPVNVALLVHTCDRYRFLYLGFSYFFNQHWNFGAQCNYYFATEELDADIANFITIKSGKGQWADRLRYLLEHVIEEKYVLYFQEDMWLNKPTEGKFFNQLFEMTAANNWKHVKLDSSSVYKTNPTTHYIDAFNVSLLDNAASGFLMSHQIALWDRQYLITQLHKGEHPWRNERKGTKRLKKLNPQIWHIDYFAENGQPAINQNKPETVRSEYHTVSQNSMLSDNVMPYIESLHQGDATAKAYAAELRNHYQNQFTHDGLLKPRKTDPVKRIKNWLLGK